MEAIRLDEGPVLKTGGSKGFGGSSPSASAMKTVLLGLLLLCACEVENGYRSTNKVCVKHTATLAEKLQCGSAAYPAQCWSWVKASHCLQWGWDYSEWTGHRWVRFPCSAANAEQQALCTKHGWKPEMVGGSPEDRREQ